MRPGNEPREKIINMGVPHAERQRRAEARYQEATREHFAHFSRVYQKRMEQAQAAAQKRLESDQERRSHRGMTDLVRSSFRSRASSWLAIRVFDFQDWDPEHAQRWLVECGTSALEAFEILYAARRKWLLKLAKANPGAAVPIPDRWEHKRALKRARLSETDTQNTNVRKK
jgi:hypothetical protein